MQQANNKPVKATHRLEPKVTVTLGIIALLSLGIFGFRYTMHKSCKNFRISIEATNALNAENFYTEVPIAFSCDAAKDDKCEWSFGTADKKKATGRYVTFSYAEPGQYLIELTVNDQCKEYRFLTVTKAPRIIDPSLIPRIICPQTIEFGKPAVFRDSTPAAKSWEWRFGESGQVDAMGKKVSYIFTTPGVKTVTLVINGNPDAYATCQVFVKPKELPKTNPNASGNILLPPINDKPTSHPLTTSQGSQVAISDADFQAMMAQVVKGKKFPSDFIPYMCGGNIQLPVSYKETGEKTKTMTFEQACREIEVIKDRKIKGVEVTLQRDPGTNCINGMSIKVSKKRGLF